MRPIVEAFRRVPAGLPLAIVPILVSCVDPGARAGAVLEVMVQAEMVAPDSLDVAVAVTDAAWRPVNGAAVELSAGEGSAVTARGLGAGRYAARLRLPPGDIEGMLTVRVRRAGGQTAERVLPLPEVR